MTNKARSIHSKARAIKLGKSYTIGIDDIEHYFFAHPWPFEGEYNWAQRMSEEGDERYSCRRFKAYINLADGTTTVGWVELEINRKGTRRVTYVLLRNGEVACHIGNDNFADWMGKDVEDVFPYRYKYIGELNSDRNIGADGWSKDIHPRTT